MKVQVNDAANSQKELLFELPYEIFEKAAEKELAKIMPEVKIPGFRPGKAPKDVVKKQYSHKIRSQAIEQVINEALTESMTENNITPLAQPNVSEVVFEENKPITFTARVDVFPDIKLEKYSGFETEKAQIKIEDKDLEETLEAIRERNASFEPVKSRKSVKNGDMAVIDFVGKLEGNTFQGGSAENFSLNIGSGQFIPGFEDGVVGMKIGETKDVEVVFPENYGQKDLAGKPAVFTVTVHEIKEKVLPDLDDELAKDVDPKLENLDQLKTSLKKGMQAEFDSSSKFDAFNDLLNQIIEANPFDIPFSFVKEQSERLAYNSMNQFYQMGINPEQVGINFEMMVQRHIPQAQTQVKQALTINAIAGKENIQVSDEDIDKFIAFHADLQNKDPKELKKELEKAHQLESIRNDVLGDKVFEFLESVNDIKAKKMTRAEYEKIKNSSKEEKPAAKKTSKAKKDSEDKEPKTAVKKEKKTEETADKQNGEAPKKKTVKKTKDAGEK